MPSSLIFVVLVAAWLATHWLLRESGIWRDRDTQEVRAAQRDADYAYRLAVDPPASKELRLFGLATWTIQRFVARRTHLHELQYAATRLRERPVIWSMLLVVSANLLVFSLLALAAADNHITLGQAVVYLQSAVGVSMIAFGGFSWAIDGAAAPVAAVLRLEPAMRRTGLLSSGNRRADAAPAREIRLRDVSFAYPADASKPLSGGVPVLERFDLTIPAGSSLAIVGQNGAGKTTIAKLLCRLYDPQSGAIEIDGFDLREFDLVSWRSRVTAVFQDLHPPGTSSPGQCGTGRRPRRCSANGAGVRRSNQPRCIGHHTCTRVHRRHGPVGRTVAAHCPSPGAGRCQARRRRRATR